MVAAKLDQSRVLVTKFRQNRLTLKGRSAGQRHTHTQTNSTENKGPSGLQSGQYYRALERGYAKSRPHDRTDYRAALCAVDGRGVCMTAQPTTTTKKSNLVY